MSGPAGNPVLLLRYSHLKHAEIFQSVEVFYRSFYFRVPEDRGDRRRNGAEPRGDEAAIAGGSRVLPFPQGTPRGRALKRLIITADDFGLANAVNEAVEQGHSDGVLSAASLMVGGAAAPDAVRRARRMPQLRVGLHLTLVDDWPILPAEAIPDLVVKAGPSTGRLRNDLASLGLAIATRASVRSQVRSEIRAQFEAYRATGLALDHVNAHRHYHLHPTILSEILAIGADYGARALRTPIEPLSDLRRVAPTPRPPVAILMAPWAAAMRRRVHNAGWVSVDRVFGLAWSGRMTEQRIAGLLSNLPPGCTEIYTHPATSADFDGAAKGYAYAEELAALMSSRCREAVRETAATVGGYADMVGP